MMTIAQVLTVLLAFAIFFFVAKKMFWGPLQQTIDERQARIKGEFDRIDSLQRQVNDVQADYQRRMADIEAEARARTQEAIAHGRQIAEQMSEQARKEIEAEKERSRQSIQIAMDQARVELKQEVVKMTLAATEKIIRQKLDEPRQRELVASFVEELSHR